uniref:Nuclear receptor domain-containing protein n=1 Tax=Meloidogyne incognita TaxID=6306 RepID=A0A914M6Z7_MELIC
MQRNFIKQCKVCGAKEKICFHYGVCTCRACGAFFRRFIENEGECKYKCKCSKENKDGKSETNLAKCKKCRLDKCLSVGMRKSGLLRYGNAPSPNTVPDRYIVFAN